MSQDVALVSGAGRGIGRGVARRLGSSGFAVAVNDVDGDNASRVAEEIREDGGRATSIEADVSEPSAVDDMVESVHDEYGRIDVLVNNAGIETVYPFLELPLEEWDRVLSVNLRGQFLLAQAVASAMVEGGVEGAIVNVSSVHDVLPRTEKIHYDTSKAGVLMLTKDMALELAEYGINVNCVAPGIMRTPMNAEILDSPEEVERMNERVPLGRMGDPNDVAEVVEFLVSDGAEYLTGVRIPVDGGLSLAP